MFILIFLKKNLPFKYLVYKKHTRFSGRSLGTIISRHRGSGSKILHRSIDFNRFLWNIYGLILTIEYNPRYNKMLSLVFYFNGILSYIAYIKGLYVGSMIITSNKTKIIPGNHLFLKYIPYGTFIHNLEFIPKSGVKYARASGSSAKVLNIFGRFILVKLSSGFKKFFFINSMATIGFLSDFFHLYKLWFRKAGFNRNFGWRPKVRGIAMNAVDHPNGGGKGKKAGKSISMSPWGKLPKMKKTVMKK